MKTFKQLLILVLLTVSLQNVSGYGNEFAHPAINKTIVNEFKTRLPNYIQNYTEFNKFKNYSFILNTSLLENLSVTKGGNVVIFEGLKNLTAEQWISEGGFTADEPEIRASLRHFYDPVRNEGVYYLKDMGLNPQINNPCIDAIYWAFDIRGTDDDNYYTWDIGKEYLIRGLREPQESVRQKYFAMAMRCLGEVLHNTADMGLPAHVRNDAHGGYGIIAGGTDPYEMLYNYKNTAVYGSAKCDPELAVYFQKSKSAKDINKRMAEFTNKYFFSHETISGEGVKAYNSANGYKNYASPKLEDFDYTPEDFSYSRKFPSGRVVRMCSDESLILGLLSSGFRGYPKVDEQSVNSQATELIPDIVEAGINVIRNFIPEFNISVSVDASKGVVSGNIKHITDAEYPNSIVFKGKVYIYINNKLSSTVLDTSDGTFSGTFPGLKNGDKVKAQIDFCDILVSSNELKIDMSAKNLLSLSAIVLRADFNYKAYGYRFQFSDWTFNSSNSTINSGSLVLNNPISGGGQFTCTSFSINYNPTTKKVEKLDITAKCMLSSVEKHEWYISLKSVAPTVANWYDAGGCGLLSLNLTDIQNYINFTQVHSQWKVVINNDGTEGGYWSIVETLGSSDLKASDSFGHSTSISLTGIK